MEVSMLVKMIVIVFVCCITPVAGQTLSEIDKLYGKPTYSYSVSQHIWMTPDYGSDGQVCRMRLYPKHVDADTDYLSPKLQFEELTSVLNRLVPLGRRGEKKDFFGLTDFGGGAALTTYGYERVTFVFAYSFRPDPSIKKQPEPESFPVAEVLARLPKKTPPSLNDFAPSKTTKIEIATITWNDRKCVP